ncbi:MAG: hypothetical protein GY864_09860 [Desulfobacterales bacterium]|nr:hypothetical protein [Desulfobacterales bacterium]
MESILGLDITEDSLAAVRVRSGLKGHDILACAHIRIKGNDGLDIALKTLLNRIGIGNDICIASIPAEKASFLNLRMPFKDAGKIRQTIPFEIETLMPFPIDDMSVDFIISDRAARTRVLAVSLKKAFISEYLSLLQGCGIDPHILDIRCAPTVVRLLNRERTPDNGLFLDINNQIVTMVLFLRRRIVLIRSFALNSPIQYASSGPGENNADTQTGEQIESRFEYICRMVNNSIHAFKWQNNRSSHPGRVYFSGTGALCPETGDLLSRFLDLPVEQSDLGRDRSVRMDENIIKVWDPLMMDGALALALRGTKKGKSFNFRKDEFETKKYSPGFKKTFRKAAAFLSVLFFLVVVHTGMDYYFLKKRYITLDRQIKEVFTRAFPDVTRIVNPVHQMRVKINEITGSDVTHAGIIANEKALDLLREISQFIPKSSHVHVSHMAIDPDAVRMSGRTDTFNTVDNITNSLESSRYFSEVIISSANLDRTAKQVRFEIKMQRQKLGSVHP